MNAVGWPEVLMGLSQIWTDMHDAAKRFAQPNKVMLGVAKSERICEITEMSLAHKVGSQVELAYDRSDLIERSSWVDAYCEFAETEWSYKRRNEGVPGPQCANTARLPRYLFFY